MSCNMAYGNYLNLFDLFSVNDKSQKQSIPGSLDNTENVPVKYYISSL